MHPAGPYTPTNIPARHDNSGPGDAWAHDLAVAQLEAMATAVERLYRAVERLGASVAELEAAPASSVAVSPDQLRLVVNG